MSKDSGDKNEKIIDKNIFSWSELPSWKNF
jgi:hypothetical protein